MRRRSKIALIVAGSLIGLLLALVAAAFLVVRSDWFFNKVRAKLVETVETASGGRVEIGSFRFDWKTLRADVANFVLHGTEPEGKPPLFRADRLSAGLKIVSLLKRDVDVEFVEVVRPRVSLILYPDGRTNIPEPKVKRTPGRNAMETILDLSVGRFQVTDGLVEVESRGSFPFEAAGRNLQARFLYEAGGPRYRGDISIDPLDFRYAGYASVPLTVGLKAVLERNRVQIAEGSIRTGKTTLAFMGSLEDLANPRASAEYDLRADLGDAARFWKLASRPSGTITLGGNAKWAGGSAFSLTGNLHAFGVDYADRSVRVRNAKADAALEVTAQRARLSGLRVTGVYQDRTGGLPVSAQIQSVTLQGRLVEASGVAVAALGGSFRGKASLRDFERFRAEGQLAGFEIKRLVAMYSKEPLPWDGLLSGPASVEGSLKSAAHLKAEARIEISPAASGAPVRGQVAVVYDAGRNLLDLGRSYVALPHSRVDLSGAVGRRLRVHLETRDLADILPAVGAGDLPLKIEAGAIVFDGTVSGKPEAPEIAGHVATGRVAWDGVSLDSVQADVTASEKGAAVRNLQATRGKLRAEGGGSLGLAGWKPAASSALAATLSLRNASIADLLGIAGRKDIPASGTLSLTAQAGGTYGSPAGTVDLSVAKGVLWDEPFDKLTAKIAFTDRLLETTGVQLAAGAKQIDLQGSFEHPPGVLDRGRLTFRLTTNAMALEQFRTLEKARPGIRGAVTASANGKVDLLPEKAGQDRFRIVDLHLEARGRGLEAAGQPLGDARLTADSQGDRLQVRMASDFARSRIRVEGEWKLAGDYPGTAKVTFTRLDFTELAAWLSPGGAARKSPVAGSAEGELLVEGPLRKPETMRGTLRIPKIEFGPAPGAAPAPNGVPLLLKNEGPIVATMANQVVTVEAARFTGRSTDVTVSGKVQLQQQKSPLDLKVIGKVDLALLHEFDRDVYSSGVLQADASVRGPWQAPQLTGRMELKDASLNLADAPNGISNANGVILFSGDRATIQTLKGVSGGGEIELSGFAGYDAGEIVFRLSVEADSVRVRYPEGVSTVADAALTFTGTTSRSMLSGTVTVQRTGFNPQADFSSILARSSEPVRTPSANTGFLGGLNFDIQIETSPDITFQSTLTEGLQAEANLRLRGTASNPALQGRINITQGQVFFFGTKYTISQGSIAFYNPVKIDPVLNIDLETKARGVDVILTVSGSLNKMTLTPRSDPPLQFSEIVALLATGRAPTSDPSQLAQQKNAAPQSWQQTGASTLLGQAVANPVAGRLQRFFGVSKLKIDPTLAGVENNPQARLTLEQQVTQDITFTYITNVTSSNPQVVRVEWAFSRQWSVVALREENGRFGMDFLYKRRFR